MGSRKTSAQRRGRREAGGRGVYLIGGALALATVTVVIVVSAFARSGGNGNGPAPGASPIVPVLRPTAVPSSGLVYGSQSAPVTVTEYFDYQCPFCLRAAVGVLPAIEQEYVETGKAKLEAKPIAILGDESVLAAQAAECANEQGRFWDFHDILFANQGKERSGVFSADNLKRFAAALGLDTAAFGSCLDSGKYAAAVRQDTAAAQAAGVKSTPTLLVNGTKVDSTLDALRTAIEAALAAGP